MTNRFIGLVLIFLLSAAANSQVGACDELSGFKQLMAGPPQSRYEYRGRYFNYASWYSVRIPRGLVGYDGRDQGRHNGFAVRIGKDSQSVVFVSGDPNSVEYNTPREDADSYREYMEQKGRRIESQSITDARLDGLNAVRLVIFYTCPESKAHRVYSSIIALSHDKSSVYEIALYSPATRYENDRAVLDQFIKSWKILSRSRW